MRRFAFCQLANFRHATVERERILQVQVPVDLIHPEQSGDVIVRATTNAMGLVEEVIPVAQRRFGVLVDVKR